MEESQRETVKMAHLSVCKPTATLNVNFIDIFIIIINMLTEYIKKHYQLNADCSSYTTLAGWT